ncbi:alpha-ketoacid dehydrogenase subunit beta [Desulfoplanes formicivorans]|uniref:Pyruvate dehydrogenase n=1 Tax=Desulfoplanes formicivorans TaxID=1592317 RepID=A0A194AKS0_9BACT|nr:alpha-ketoacid dehydrogenase subunit beta [Desulfoplanes formicivorans]GAU09304.1 pyruvate dehydrogenase [Desulfoplanes formicivorans]
MQNLHTGVAIQNGLRLAMEMDDRVFLAGEGIGVSIHANPLMPTHGLLETFGPKRVRDTPVSEAAIAGLAVGASAMGLLPVVEIMFFPFITLASDMLVNHAAKLRYLSGGKTAFPLTVRVKAGVMSAGCQHSHNLETWLAHIPGLKVTFASTPADAKGLLLSAIFDPDPVIVVEEMGLYWTKGPVPPGDVRVPLGKAAIRRPGNDVTVVGYGGLMFAALEAAEKLEAEGVSVEVIDLRTLVPLDRETILESIARTGRLVIVHEATKFCGFGAELAALAAEEGFSSLSAPVRRVAGPDIPVPFSPPQEQFYMPNAQKIAEAVRSIM